MGVIDPDLLHQLASTPIRPALVTGAARGIGRAIAARLVRDGAPVVLLDRDPAVADTAAELGATGWVVADVSDPAEVRRAVADTLDCLGGLWALVNNAGIFGKTPLLEIDPAEWDEVMAVNARSVLLTTQAVAPAMIAAGGGRIVNLSSMAAKAGTPGEAAYAASKAAVMALTRIAAAELGPHGITVNCVCPGYVLTDMGAESRTTEQVEAWAAQSPLGRCGTPDDVAGVVAHLVSDDAAYQTGQAVNVSGGMLAW
jgi:NAD(P)-dependent dehydrogenase (short-subunit alcohol dehydrogenase family)